MPGEDSLFSPYATGKDVSYLFRVTSAAEQDTLFSDINIPSITQQFTSLPVDILPPVQDVPESTLFGAFSEQVQSPSSPSSSCLSLPEEVTQHTIPDDDDLWQHTDSQPPVSKVNTWESFGAQRTDNFVKVNPFVTEQSPKVFDELLRRHMNHIYSPNESGTVVDEYLFRECLLAVSIGRESSLFTWNDQIACFEPVIQNLRIIAISPVAAQSIITIMCRRGTIFRRLTNVTENILRSPVKTGSIAISFARAITSIIQHWQSEIQTYSPTQGLLSLSSQFHSIDESLFELARLCACNSRIIQNRQIPSPALGGQLLSNLYQVALRFDYPTASPLRALGTTLLAHTCRIFLDLLTYWIGFPAQPWTFSDVKEWYNVDLSGEFFVQRVQSNELLSVKTITEFYSLFQFDGRMVPGFVGRDVAKRVFEMGCGLRLLWRCQRDHPLCDVFDVARQGEERLELKWLLSWDEIHGTHDRLDAYAEKMWTAMDQYGKHPDKTRKVVLSMTVDIDDTTDFGLYETKEAAEQMISSTMQQMSLVPETKSTDTIIEDFISLHKTLQSSTPIPLLSLIAQNSFTHALDIQANLIQHALLSLFFDSLHLRKHLETLNSYLLFGNGVFVTRLHEALFEDFDDDGRSGGQPGLGLGMGLKGKNNWPPNSAKVGLVLRNILSQSGVDTTGISFAYRELSEEQFNKVQNPIGLEALDFLQLLYKPTFPLDAIITPSILDRYDRIFLFLIRLLRMQYISHQLFRDATSRTSYTQGINPISQRFRIEAHHFITAISGYIFNVSIAGNWHIFTQQLDKIYISLSSRSSVISISELTELHARVLDKICFSCFLKTSQLPMLTLLYATFEPVLLFAKTSRMDARREQRVWTRMREEMEDNTRILYAQFVKRAGMFVRVVEELERRGVGQRGVGEGFEGGWFADLLVRLDGSYFDR